ncbi:MAG TPA: septum formation initiator family protein [Gammaproteobacteria bacterium]|nr:septum formation initiator family protein [Gammaproteobacteria bacterium]
MRWLIILGLAVCLVLLQRALWSTTSSLGHGSELARQVEQLKQENAKLEQGNSRRWAEVKDLKRGGAAIEEHARMDLGFVKKGETFYQIVKAPAPVSALPNVTAPVPASTIHGG